MNERFHEMLIFEGKLELQIEDLPDFPNTLEVSTRLHEGAIRKKLSRRAPCVGQNTQRSNGVRTGIEQHGVRSAVVLEDQVIAVPASPTCERR